MRKHRDPWYIVILLFLLVLILLPGNIHCI